MPYLPIFFCYFIIFLIPGQNLFANNIPDFEINEKNIPELLVNRERIDTKKDMMVSDFCISHPVLILNLFRKDPKWKRYVNLLDVLRPSVFKNILDDKIYFECVFDHILNEQKKGFSNRHALPDIVKRHFYWEIEYYFSGMGCNRKLKIKPVPLTKNIDFFNGVIDALALEKFNVDKFLIIDMNKHRQNFIGFLNSKNTLPAINELFLLIETTENGNRAGKINPDLSLGVQEFCQNLIFHIKNF